MENEIKTVPAVLHTSVHYYGSGSTGMNTYPDQYMLAILQNGNIQSLSGHLYSGITTMYELLNHKEKKESFYILAVDNLMKKNDFLQLSIQLDQQLITEEEFEKELEENESKYLIKMNNNCNKVDFEIALDILPKLNRTFTADEVSELFAIPLENIHYYLDGDVKIENS